MSDLSPSDVQAAIAQAIEQQSVLLRAPATVNRIAILRAICDVETSGGARWGATLHEDAYCYTGRYYIASDALKRQSVPWGCLAHSSFGPWQILFITAYEQGYSGDPVGLRDPMTSAEYVVKVLNARVFDKLADAAPEDAFDAWNSGRARDSIIPADYIKKAKASYLSHILTGGPVA